VVEEEVREFMEQDQPAEGQILGGPEHNAVGVRTPLVAVDQAIDAGLLGHARHEPNTDPALAFQSMGQRFRGAVWWE
jgi:hypothetical protein